MFVAVWMPEQLATFLHAGRHNGLFALVAQLTANLVVSSLGALVACWNSGPG